MARLFNDAALDRLVYTGAAAVTGVPLTMACWFYCDDATQQLALVSIGDTAGGDNWIVLRVNGEDVGDPVQAAVANVSGAVASSSTGYSVNTWHHAAATFTAVDNRAAYIDGGSKGTDTTSITPAGLDATGIGVRVKSSNDTHFSGRIAEAAIWNVALSDAEVAALAKGFSPTLMRPDTLVGYWPLFGNDASELDRWENRFDMTVTGATKADHPRIYYPHAIP